MASGYVMIRRGPLEFSVNMTRPLTRAQIEAIADIAGVMEAIEPLFVEEVKVPVWDGVAWGGIVRP